MTTGLASVIMDLSGKKSAPPGTRTPNPQIKSLLLCQLS
jgi:hypothetical protein